MIVQFKLEDSALGTPSSPENCGAEMRGQFNSDIFRNINKGNNGTPPTTTKKKTPLD